MCLHPLREEAKELRKRKKESGNPVPGSPQSEQQQRYFMVLHNDAFSPGH
jgi:hypothetical protein